MKKSPLLLILLPILLSLLSACGGSGMSNDEITSTFQSLVEASYELNDVYYGDGLPFQQNESVMKYLTGVAEGTDGFRVSYMPVAEDSPYKSESEIREATKSVFSDSMCSLLFALGFEGMSAGDADNSETVSFARYIEKENILTVRIDLADDAIPMGRTYDFSQMKIIADESSRIKASFPSYINGEKSVDVSITIVKTTDGWRLDSPTY